jgi:AcrR family transcriptional regulator
MGKSEETRLLIIKKAASIFNQYGYKGTSMAQLTKAINMTKGAIYGNFNNKNEIALAAFEYNVAKISETISEIVRPKKHACDRIIAYANFYLDHFGEISKTGGCPVLNAAIDSDNVHQLLKYKVIEVIENWINSISQIVYNGIQRMQVHPHSKPEQFASVFVSLIEGGMMLSKITSNTIYLARNVDHIIYLVNTDLRL